MKINKQRIIEAFKLRYTGTKGWMVGMTCPNCGRSDKFGVILNENGISSFNCWHASCSYKGTIVKLLKKLNRLDLLERDDIDISQKIKNKILISNEKIFDYGLANKSKPLGFRYIDYDPYLELRGFTEEQYRILHIGIALIEPRLKDKYLIFLQYQDNELKGYLARSKRSKQWHKQNEINYKLGKEKLILRYDNSKNTDFEKMLGGIDEVIEGVTDTVIIVEGVTDKANTDRQLDLYSQPYMKCCFTYGNKMTDYQIKRLQDKKIENIVLLYDYNTIKQTQQYSLQLDKYFNTKIGEITTPDRDPGDMCFDEFINIFNNLKHPIDYKINRVQKKVLK